MGWRSRRFEFKGFPSAAVRRAAERNGLEIIACTALTGHLSLATEEAPAALAFLREAIRWAAELGAGDAGGSVLFGGGVPAGAAQDRRGVEACGRGAAGTLAPALEATGVQLAVEPLNRFETHMLNTAEDARRLCDAVHHPQVGVLFDTFHANIEEKNIAGAIAAIGPYLKHVHTCENDRGTPGTGTSPGRNCSPLCERRTTTDGW